MKQLQVFILLKNSSIRAQYTISWFNTCQSDINENKRYPDYLYKCNCYCYNDKCRTGILQGHIFSVNCVGKTCLRLGLLTILVLLVSALLNCLLVYQFEKNVCSLVKYTCPTVFVSLG